MARALAAALCFVVALGATSLAVARDVQVGAFTTVNGHRQPIKVTVSMPMGVSRKVIEVGCVAPGKTKSFFNNSGRPNPGYALGDTFLVSAEVTQGPDCKDRVLCEATIQARPSRSADEPLRLLPQGNGCVWQNPNPPRR